MDSVWLSLNVELSYLCEWFRVNGLTMNVSKTQIVHFITTPREPINSIKFQSKQLDLLENLNFLDILIDQKLN